MAEMTKLQAATVALQETKRKASATRKERREAMDAEYNAAIVEAYKAFEAATV